MQHKQRGGLVPVGEVFSVLGGPLQEIRKTSHQALHHFTQADQVVEYPLSNGFIANYRDHVPPEDLGGVPPAIPSRPPPPASQTVSGELLGNN